MFHPTKFVLWHLKWNSFFICNEISLNVQMKTFSLFVDDIIQMLISNLLIFFCDGNKSILSVAVAFDLAQRQFCFCITHSPCALFWLWFILGLSGWWHLAYCFCWCGPICRFSVWGLKSVIFSGSVSSALFFPSLAPLMSSPQTAIAAPVSSASVSRSVLGSAVRSCLKLPQRPNNFLCKWCEWNGMPFVCRVCVVFVHIQPYKQGRNGIDGQTAADRKVKRGRLFWLLCQLSETDCSLSALPLSL